VQRYTPRKNQQRLFMSRNGITYLDVARCAEELSASNDDPTIERIRIRLKTGSNSTIGTHLRAWRAKQDPLQQLATKENIPEELIRLLKGLWERVIDQAETQVEAIKNDTQHDLTQHKQMIQELQQNNARLKQSEIQLKQTCDGYAQEKIALEQIISKSHIDIAALQAKLDGLTQQLVDKQIRIEELHKQNKQTQANLEHYRLASLEQRQQDQQHAEQRERELTSTLQQVKMENESLRQQKTGLQQAHDQLQSTQNNLQEQLQQMALHKEKNVAELMALKAALEKKTTSEEHWQTQYEAIGIKWENEIKTSVELKTQNANLSQQLIEIKTRLDDIAEQNKVLAHDKWILGQEKSQLFGQMKQLQNTL
jgi:chromosome segregation ATPase